MRITVPSDVLNRTLRAVAKATATDETRPHLNSVWMRGAHGHHPYAFATNGHWLAGARMIDGGEVVEPGQAGVLRADLPTVLAHIPKRPVSVAISLSGQALRFDFPSSSVTVVATNAKPPAVHEVVPDRKSTKVHQRASISLDVLEPALAAMRILTKGRKRLVGLRLYAMGPDNCAPQIAYTRALPEFFAILMPMRDSGPRDMAWWHEVGKLTEPKAPTKVEATEAAAQ